MNEALNEAVRAAVAEICQTVLGRQVKAAATAEGKAGGRSYETSVVIAFVGSISGAFALRCSTKVGAMIATQMLGTPIPEASDDMKDAIGEFFNMVVGSAKTRFTTAGDPLKISVPTTIIGERYVLHIKANDADTVTVIDFEIDTDGMAVEIYLR